MSTGYQNPLAPHEWVAVLLNPLLRSKPCDICLHETIYGTGANRPRTCGRWACMEKAGLSNADPPKTDANRSAASE